MPMPDHVESICLVVPVLNERDNIEPLVVRVREALSDHAWELLFVDDDSADGTADEVRRISANDSRVRLILRIAEPGLANSCIQGMLSTTAELLCVMDGDGQHDPRYIPAMIAALSAEGADLASAARRLEAANDSLGRGRTLLSKTGNALVRAATHRHTRDPLTGFFVIRRKAFLGVARRLSNSGFKLLFDILASHPGLRHVEVPFDFQPRQAGESKLGPLVIWQFALLLAEKLSRGWLPARAISFLTVGSAGLLVHMAVLYTLLLSSAGFAVSQGGAALMAMTFNFILNNTLTFRDRRFRGIGLLKGWMAYLLICSVGLAANVSVATWAYDQMRGFAMLAALAGIAMDVMWKFVISDRLLWRRRTAR